MVNEAAKEVLREAVDRLTKVSQELISLSNQVGTASTQIDNIDQEFSDQLHAAESLIDNALVEVDEAKSSVEELIERADELENEDEERNN